MYGRLKSCRAFGILGCATIAWLPVEWNVWLGADRELKSSSIVRCRAACAAAAAVLCAVRSAAVLC